MIHHVQTRPEEIKDSMALKFPRCRLSLVHLTPTLRALGREQVVWTAKNGLVWPVDSVDLQDAEHCPEIVGRY